MSQDPQLERFDRLSGAIERSPWLAPLRGSWPQVPSIDTLPTAREEYRYRMVVLRGTPDVLYICLRTAASAWTWEVASTG